jgi:methylphosphotriester-DNA--protein-cysteine methyltransferase
MEIYFFYFFRLKYSKQIFCKCQRNVNDANLENNFSISVKFTDVYCNCKQQLSQSNCFTIEDKTLITNN